MTDGFDPFGLSDSGSVVSHHRGHYSQAAVAVPEDDRLRVRKDPLSKMNQVNPGANAGLVQSPQSVADGNDGQFFDPFGIAGQRKRSSNGTLFHQESPLPVSRTTHKKAPTTCSVTAASAAPSSNTASVVTPTSTCTTSSVVARLPPKMMIKLSIHEEVSSVALQTGAMSSSLNAATAGSMICGEGASHVAVEGTILAQVQSSDAKKNAPFVLHVRSTNSSITDSPISRNFNFLPENKLSQSITLQANSGSNNNNNYSGLLVKVPKEEIGFVHVGNYTFTEQVPHLPILLERKVTIQNTAVRIAVQVRSKLSNRGDLEDFTIAVAVPEHVDGRSVKVLRGDGVWDDLKRIIKWRLASLKTGDSYMATAQAKLWISVDQKKGENIPSITESINFPVIIRCSAPADQVSTIDLQAVQANGHPASLTVSKTYSFRMLHRLT